MRFQRRKSEFWGQTVAWVVVDTWAPSWLDARVRDVAGNVMYFSVTEADAWIKNNG